MNSNFKPINLDFSNEDIISVDGKLFEIKQFKEESKAELEKKLSIPIPGSYSELSRQLFSWLNKLEFDKTRIKVNNITWESEIIDSRILRLGSQNQNWQKIKLKLKIACISLDGYSFSPQDVFLEYCIDEPEIQESPLDEMRKMFNQNNSEIL